MDPPVTITFRDLERSNPIFAALRRLDASPLDRGGLDSALLVATTHGPATDSARQILEIAIELKAAHVTELEQCREPAAEFHRHVLAEYRHRLAEIRAYLAFVQKHAEAYGLTQPSVPGDTSAELSEPTTR